MARPPIHRLMALPRAHRLVTAARSRLAVESGSVLIEVLVSAALLLAASVGVMLALANATAQSGTQRNRAVAANVAVTQLENVRALKFSQVVDINRTTTTVLGGTTYTAVTKAVWTGAPNVSAAACADAARSPDSLRVSVTVSWPRMGSAKPVVLTSILAAPASASQQRGAIITQITDRNGFGVGSILVTLAGGASASAQTDDNGCVRFSDLPTGSYTIAFNQPPRQLQDGTQRTNVVDPVDVTAGQTVAKGYQYDVPPPATVVFQFSDGGVIKPATVRDTMWRLGTGTPVVVSPATPGNTVTAPSNFAGGTYKVWADRCTSADPTQLTQNVVQPGGTLTVNLPAARVKVMYNGGALANAQVYLTSPCGTRFGPYTTGSDGWTPTDGLPYHQSGTYAVCAQQSGYRKTGTMTIQNYNARNELTLDASAPVQGSCP